MPIAKAKINNEINPTFFGLCLSRNGGKFAIACQLLSRSFDDLERTEKLQIQNQQFNPFNRRTA